MKIEEFKMKVTSEQSRIVQETLFENGYRWHSGRININHLDSPYLYFREHIDGNQASLTRSSIFAGDQPELTFQQFKQKYIDEEFVLPEKWCIKITEDNREIVKDWMIKNIYDASQAFTIDWYYSNQVSNNFGREIEVDGSMPMYPEITFEQFKKHVLKQDDMKEDKKIIGYKLKDQKYFTPASLLLFGNTSGIDVWTYGNIMPVKEYSNIIKELNIEGVLDLWFEPVYKEQPKTLYFGKVKFTITPGEKVASTIYGDISKTSIKEAIKYIENPPSLIGHNFNIHIGSSEPKSLSDIGRNKVTSHKIGFGCQSGTLDELINIYHAFD